LLHSNSCTALPTALSFFCLSQILSIYRSVTFEITMSVIVDAELKEELKEVLEFSCCTMKR
jgi:hypothetical protein